MSKKSIPCKLTRRQQESLDQLRARIQKALWRGASAEKVLELCQILEQAEKALLSKDLPK